MKSMSGAVCWNGWPWTLLDVGQRFQGYTGIGDSTSTIFALRLDLVMPNDDRLALAIIVFPNTTHLRAWCGLGQLEEVRTGYQRSGNSEVRWTRLGQER